MKSLKWCSFGLVWPGLCISLPPVLAPNLYLLVLDPNLYLPTLVPNFYLTVLALNFYLPTLVANLYLQALANNFITSPGPDFAYTELVSSICICIYGAGPRFVLLVWGLNLHLPLQFAFLHLICITGSSRSGSSGRENKL